jgi:hypothetical protein
MNVITDLLPYYGQPQLAPYVAELMDATKEIEDAFVRQEAAIEALVEAYRKLEEERAPLREAALREAAE